jgi:PIN domain nuclease of toxin-antitoxin system
MCSLPPREIFIISVYVLDTLRLHHNDPFERLLMAQAKAEQAWRVSSDRQFPPYLVGLIW